MGLDTNPTSNYYLNNFVTSIPCRPTAKRSISEVESPPKLINAARVKGINDIARKTYH
jgi:hypothetical protein